MNDDDTVNAPFYYHLRTLCIAYGCGIRVECFVKGQKKKFGGIKDERGLFLTRGYNLYKWHSLRTFIHVFIPHGDMDKESFIKDVFRVNSCLV